jgi:hypothetical protein
MANNPNYIPPPVEFVNDADELHPVLEELCDGPLHKMNASIRTYWFAHLSPKTGRGWVQYPEDVKIFLIIHMSKMQKKTDKKIIYAPDKFGQLLKVCAMCLSVLFYGHCIV